MNREEMIADLLILSGLSKGMLEKMSNEQLERLYAERVLEKGMI